MAARVGVIVLLGVLALAACGSDSDSEASPPITTVTITVPPSATPAPPTEFGPTTIKATEPSTPPTTRQPSTKPTSSPTADPSAVPASLLGKDLERIPTSKKVVALTFDGGASDDAVDAILATLAAKKVPATFFLTGDFAVQFPGASKAIANAGQRLANHSMTHPYFTDLTASAIRDEIRSAEAEIHSAAGASPRPFFRFPFGDRDTRTIKAVNDAGYVPIRWTVDTLGWKGTSGGQSVDTVIDRVLGALQPGEIVLMHVGAHPTDHSTLDADALPKLIDLIRAEGYTFVSLDALL